MEDNTTKKTTQTIRGYLPLVYLIVALLALRWTIVEPYVVPTGSMEPTLKPGDRLYALKCAYDIRFPFTDWIVFRTGQVKRGDVILFRAPKDPSVTYVKRAVGLPGDKIRFSEGRLFINGEEIQKSPVPNDTPLRGIMYDIENQEDKTLYLEQLGKVKHYVILDNRFNGGSGSVYGDQDFHHRFMDEIEIPPGHYFAVGDNRDNSYDSRAWGFVPEANLKGRAMFIWFSSREWFFSPRPERVGTLIQ
jgi:signal peptidase I